MLRVKQKKVDLIFKLFVKLDREPNQDPLLQMHGPTINALANMAIR